MSKNTNTIELNLTDAEIDVITKKLGSIATSLEMNVKCLKAEGKSVSEKKQFQLDTLNKMINVLKANSDYVTVTCYRNKMTLPRGKAIAFYKECAMNCDGCERERYQNIVDKLNAGLKVVDDSNNW